MESLLVSFLLHTMHNIETEKYIVQLFSLVGHDTGAHQFSIISSGSEFQWDYNVFLLHIMFYLPRSDIV